MVVRLFLIAVLWLSAVCLSGALPAAEAKVDAVEFAKSQTEAGLAAMKAADTDPDRAVEAALAFAQALHVYQQLGDTDTVCEMQANIYWCKKRMNVDALTRFVASKDSATKDAAVRVQDILSKTVPVTEADAYLARADAFRGAHAERHFELAVRYSEIMERFPGTPAATTATAAFARAQTDYLAEVAAARKQEAAEREQEKAQVQLEINHVRATRFSTPPPMATDATTPLPDAATRAKALILVKQNYAAGYAKNIAAGKRSLARRLAAEADGNRGDSAVYDAMLDEAARLAGEGEDYELLLQAIERRAAAFAGIDVIATQRAALTKLKQKPVAAGILKLMDDPADKAANTLVGRSYCLDTGRWDAGVPLLALGTDAGLAKVADLELSEPAAAEQQAAVGDAWYDLGKKVSGSDRVALWARAQHWFEQAVKGLGAVQQTRVKTLMAEIDKTLPLTVSDYGNLTTAQWDKLKGTLITVEAKVDRSSSGITVKSREKLRVVPYPDDRGRFRLRVGKDEPQDAGILTGTGVLWVEPQNLVTGKGKHRKVTGRTGMIRFKVIPVSDDD